MSSLVFYEKPGCMGNRGQKELLTSQGHRFEVRDILTEAWNKDRLRPFFGNKPVPEWFNMTAPQIKDGWVDVEGLSEQQALNLMVIEPILIKRPLLELGELKQSGFTAGPVLNSLGVLLEPDQNLQDCPMGGTSAECEVPA
ncbi:MAG: ArsC/Spx/MgsR family protein [Sedimenticola sp.]